MKLNKIFKSAAILCAGTMLMTGCASDYLDTPVHGTTSTDDICKTTASARAAMLGVHYGMTTFWGNTTLGPYQGMNQGETSIQLYIGETPGQDCFLNYIYDLDASWTPYYNMDQGYLNTGDYPFSNPVWLYSYAMIAQVNEILEQIDAAEGDESEREFTKGQAHTMRAHCYWRLLQTYGPRWEDSKNGEALTVCKRTHSTDPQDLAASSMNDILDLIYQDLDDAIEAFGKAGNYSRSFTYETDLNIAYGVYARVAALKHDWETCRTMANKARKGYRPATVAEAMAGYNSFNQNEWMWSPSFETLDNAIYGNCSTMFACNGYYAINLRTTNCIDIMLYRQLPETDARRDWWMTVDKLSGVTPQQAYNSRAVNPVNQQFTAAALIRAARTWLDEHQAKYNTPGDPAYSGTGQGVNSTSILRDGAQVKFWNNGLTGNSGRSNIPFMRASEMYLLEAEACAELNKTIDAQNLLNELNRSFNPEYTCTATGTALMDEIRLYRRIELWGEGHNWFDLKRWNLPLKRTAWEEGNPASGNLPEPLCPLVPASQNNGWRHGIPYAERQYNMAVPNPIPGEIIGG